MIYEDTKVLFGRGKKMRREIEKPFEKWATNGRRRMNERIKSRSRSDISSVHIIRYHDHRKEERKRLKRRKKRKKNEKERERERGLTSTLRTEC